MQDIIISYSLEADLATAVGRIAPDRLFVLADDTTAACCWPIVKDYACLAGAQLITIGSTDGAKTLDTLATVWQRLGEQGATRHSALINLGGGMVTDLGGFAAATFKRGMAFVNVPTTLLAMVDASVGGKTGINFRGLKNEIGAFCDARTVVIHTPFLRTLDAENLRSGYAEMLKHGLISSAEETTGLLAFDIFDVDYEALADLVGRSIQVKERIVAEDPYEHGLRKALNLGHTIGHAFESFALENHAPVLHGYAVAWGLVCELYLSVTRCGFPMALFHQVEHFVSDVYGHFALDCKHYDHIFDLMTHDKKNIAGQINMTLLAAPGDVRINQVTQRDDIFEALDYYRES